MSDTSTVTYSTAEILKRIEDKIDSNNNEMRQEIKEINQKIDNNHKEINQKIDNNQKEMRQEIKDINQKIDNNHTEVKQEIEEFKKDVNDKLDKVNERLTHLEVGQATLTEKVGNMDTRLQNVEGTQKNQIWTLIVLVAGAIITGAAKLFFTINP